MQNLTVGEQLRILIKREGLKQTELAEKLNIDRRSVSQSMKMFDENRGTIKTLMEYANALGYDVKIEFEKKEEQERAMKNVTCPKLANTLVKLQQVYNEFYEEYDRAYDLGVRDKNDKMESDFTTSFDNIQGVIATLMANLLQSDLYRAVPYEVQP